MVRLDVISDPICPWCYIGKTRLDEALAERPDHPFDIVWHPFQLSPNMPPHGMDRRDYLEGKFGGKEGAIRAYAPVLEAATEAGLDIDFAAIKRTPNTINAHRLIHWAQLEGLQTEAVEALFVAYFKTGRDIGDPATLAQIGQEIGLDHDMITRLLDGGSDIEDVRARDAQFREMGVGSVPFFIVAGHHAVPGAQSKDLWLSVIDEIAEQAANAPQDPPAP